MLSARQQAIGGTRTFISEDSQPCRLLPNDAAVSMVPPIIRPAGFPQYGWKVGRIRRYVYPSSTKKFRIARLASVLPAPRCLQRRIPVQKRTARRAAAY